MKANLTAAALAVWSDVLRAALRERHLAVTMVSSSAGLMAGYLEPQTAARSDERSVAHLVVLKALRTAARLGDR